MQSSYLAIILASCTENIQILQMPLKPDSHPVQDGQTIDMSGPIRHFHFYIYIGSRVQLRIYSHYSPVIPAIIILLVAKELHTEIGVI